MNKETWTPGEVREVRVYSQMRDQSGGTQTGHHDYLEQEWTSPDGKKKEWRPIKRVERRE